MLTPGGLCPRHTHTLREECRGPPPHLEHRETSPSLGALAVAESTRASPNRPLGREGHSDQSQGMRSGVACLPLQGVGREHRSQPRSPPQAARLFTDSARPRTARKQSPRRMLSSKRKPCHLPSERVNGADYTDAPQVPLSTGSPPLILSLPRPRPASLATAQRSCLPSPK